MTERFETFTVLIARISRSIRRIKNAEMAAYDLRSPHISCLYYLYTVRDLTATELCEKCEEDKATVSRSLDYLEKNGYLTRSASAGKRYRAPIILTPRGEEVGGRIAQKVDHVLKELDTTLDEETRTNFYSSLSRIANELEHFATQAEIDGISTEEGERT